MNLNVSNPKILKEKINIVVEIIKGSPSISKNEIKEKTGFTNCIMNKIWNIARRRALK